MEAGVTNQCLHTIGERCYLQKYNGTIQYVGEVPPTEGIWYGVEWDAERGKHDGMLHGVRYFQCRDKYGSFVRPHKIYFGVDANAGLKKRYGNSKLSDENAIILHEKTNRETVIEMVGFEKIAMKQSNFGSLREADLSLANISHGLDCGLEYLSPNLRSLNLRGNLLSSLKDIYRIAGNLKLLKTLNISENRITDWNTGDLDLSIGFQQVTTIYLNKMCLKWHQLMDALTLTPNVKDVHSCFNEISDVRYDASLENIEVLNLEGNKISDWNSVLNLSKLSRLQKLILNSNQITKLEMISEPVETPFKNLLSFSLSDNVINEWYSVNQLNSLKSVTELRFKGNPVCEDATGFGLRQELIARLEHVKALNGSPVTERERKAAETAYVKKYLSEYYKAKGSGTTVEFTRLHPMYPKIISAHGLPEEQVTTTKSLKDNLLALEFKCPDCTTKPATQKKVPPTMTVQQLKGILQRLYKIPNSKQRISYVDVKNSREIKLEDNMKQLSFYSLASGDTVLLRW